ncbi:MAG: hypothetical protein EBR09_15735 [Proteobacteria bacterium]|jgi:hypothetical protein|nr:hypothetical protein [Pseudomonadota bacterium]
MTDTIILKATYEISRNYDSAELKILFKKDIENTLSVTLQSKHPATTHLNAKYKKITQVMFVPVTSEGNTTYVMSLWYKNPRNLSTEQITNSLLHIYNDHQTFPLTTNSITRKLLRFSENDLDDSIDNELWKPLNCNLVKDDHGIFTLTCTTPSALAPLSSTGLRNEYLVRELTLPAQD